MLFATNRFLKSCFVWKIEFKESKLCPLENGMFNMMSMRHFEGLHIILFIIIKVLWIPILQQMPIRYQGIIMYHISSILTHDISISSLFCAVFEYICSLSPWLKSLIDWLDLHRANFCTWGIYMFWAHVLISDWLVKLFLGPKFIITCLRVS